jgi:hypothetical protein
MSIGEFIGDAIRNITGFFSIADLMRDVKDGTQIGALYYAHYGDIIPHLGGNGQYPANSGIGFDASRVVPTAAETRPASISSYLCIKY